MSRKNYKIALTAIIILMSYLVLQFVGNSNVYATEDTISITNVEIIEKTETVDVESLSYENTAVNANIVYHKVGDYVKYKITINNNSNQNYKIKSLSNDNKNEYISYEHSNYSNTEFKSNSSTELFITVKYLKEIDDITKRIQETNTNLLLIMEDANGNTVTKNISINPKTGDPIIKYIIVFSISALGLLVFAIARKKGCDRKKIFGIILALILTMPVVVNASGSSLTLNLKGKVELKDKLIGTYKDALGNEKTIIVKYGESANVPGPLEKEGYDFVEWNDENGVKVEGEIKDIKQDFKLTQNWKAKEYKLTYNLNGGEAETVSTYTIDTNDITLPQPTRKGYSFDGWTGDNGDTPQKEVVIKKGSKGNKTYTANWKIEEYTLAYDLDGGDISGQKVSYTVETETFTLPIPTKENYKFIGWTGTDLESETTTVTIQKGSTGNRSYKANWKEKSKIEIGKYQYPSDQDYMYFSNADWKSTSITRSPYPWKKALPSLVFEEEITRARLGFSTINYVTYNSQTMANGFVSTDKKIMWFDNNYGEVREGYYTVGYTQNSVDHEIRFRIVGDEITDFQEIY